jgi:hypothetical protein
VAQRVEAGELRVGVEPDEGIGLGQEPAASESGLHEGPPMRSDLGARPGSGRQAASRWVVAAFIGGSSSFFAAGAMTASRSNGPRSPGRTTSVLKIHLCSVQATRPGRFRGEPSASPERMAADPTPSLLDHRDRAPAVPPSPPCDSGAARAGFISGELVSGKFPRRWSQARRMPHAVIRGRRSEGSVFREDYVEPVRRRKAIPRPPRRPGLPVPARSSATPSAADPAE